jgi:hypothetical protein
MERIVTVTTAASSPDLVSLETVNAELAIAGNGDDALLKRRIAAASRAIAGYCRRTLVEETVSEQFRPDRRTRAIAASTDALYLSRWPVSSIASVTQDGITLAGGTDYELEPQSGRLTRLISGSRAPWCFQLLIVAYAGGYDQAALADSDLEEAAIELVRDMWAARGRDPMVKRESVPGVLDTEYWVGQVGEANSWPPRMVDLLAPYVDASI